MFRTSLQVSLSSEPDDCEPFARRRVVRALADVRRTLENRTSGDYEPPRGPQVELLVDVARCLRLTAFETIDALGAQIMDDRAWRDVLERLFAGKSDEEIETAQRAGAELGPLELGGAHAARGG